MRGIAYPVSRGKRPLKWLGDIRDSHPALQQFLLQQLSKAELWVSTIN